MGFQKQVNITPAIGKAGELARNLPNIHLARKVEGTGLKTGSLCFAGSTSEQVKALGSAGVAPVGIAVLGRMQFNGSNVNSLEMRAGEEVAVYETGFIFFTCASAAVGQKIAIKPTTGEVEAYNASGSPSADYVDSGWVVDVASNGDNVCVVRK